MMTDVKDRDDCLRETNRELVLTGLRGGGGGYSLEFLCTPQYEILHPSRLLPTSPLNLVSIIQFPFSSLTPARSLKFMQFSDFQIPGKVLTSIPVLGI